jgi:hypothetical protein
MAPLADKEKDMSKLGRGLTGVAGALAVVATPVLAQDAGEAELDRIKAQAELAEAQADLAKAEADRIKALGLPSFEGKTELKGTDAGAMEATLLASQALAGAAEWIANSVNEEVLLLAGDEAVDFGVADAMLFELQAIEQLYQIAGYPLAGDEKMVGGGIAEAIAGVSAVAGMLRTETELSFAPTTAMTDGLLAAAVAGRLAARGQPPIMPKALIGGVSPQNELLTKHQELLALRLRAEQEQTRLAAVPKPSAGQKTKLEAIKRATSRHDAFLARATTADAKGAVPIATAARLAELRGTTRPVLRVYVDKAGGSLVNSKNIATYFGVDPLKVSGGLVTHFTVSQPNTGKVTRAGLLSCNTTLTSIRRVQERRWRKPATNDRLCESLLPAPAAPVIAGAGGRPISPIVIQFDFD